MTKKGDNFIKSLDVSAEREEELCHRCELAGREQPGDADSSSVRTTESWQVVFS